MREFDLPPTICPPPLLEFHKQFPLEPLGPHNKCDVRALRFALGHWVRWGRGGGGDNGIRSSFAYRSYEYTKYNRRVVQLLRDPRISPRLFER